MEYIQKNYAWLIAALVAVGALIINLAVTKNRARKAFSRRTVLDTTLISKKNITNSKVEVLYDGKPVESVRIIQIELRNTGAKEILPADFVEPVQLIFPDSYQVFEAEIAKKHPGNFSPKFSRSKNTFTLEPTLMNAGDWVILQVIAGFSEAAPILIDGRISGVSEFTLYGPERPFSILKELLTHYSIPLR